MNRRSGQYLIALGLCLCCTAVANAQGSTDLLLEKSADVEQVASGDQLRFVLTLINSGTDELTNLAVRDAIPAGTVFLGASAPSDWMMTTPQLMGAGDIVWRNTSSLAPGERVALEFLVSVQAAGGSSLVSHGCTVQADNWNEPLLGPSITVAVVTPTATLPPAKVITGDDGSWLGLGVAGLALLLGAVAVERWLNRGANR